MTKIPAYILLFALAGCAPTANRTGPVAGKPNSQSDLSPASTETDYSRSGALVVAGSRCPDFKYTSLDGSTVRLSDYAGKALLIDIFSPT